MLINKNKKTSGFAMIELLVYLGIFGVVVAMLTGILTSVTKTQVEESAQNDVAGQLNFAMQTIQRLIKTSSIVNSEIGVATSTLSLIMPNSAYNPTQIYSSNGTLYIKQGNNASQSITSNKVRVDILEFKRLVQAGARDVVQIDLVLSGVAEVEGKILTRALRSAVSRASAVTFDSDLLPAVDNSYNVGASPATRWKDGAYSGNLTVGGSATAGSFCLSGNCITTWTSGGGGTWGSITGTLSAQTDLQSALNAKLSTTTAATTYIPYTGGTSNVNLGLHNLTVDTNSLFVDSVNHRVGIGTITPGAKLQINSGATTDIAAIIKGYTGQTADIFQVLDSTGAPFQRITSGGTQYINGGLITYYAPGGYFELNGTSGTLSLGVEWNSAKELQLTANSTLNTFATIGAGSVFTSGLRLGANGGTNMTLMPGGNVGIGTTSPLDKLHILSSGGGRMIFGEPTAGYEGFTFANAAVSLANYSLIGNGAGTYISRPTGGNISFREANGVDQMTILTGGNVGIGTTAPGQKLEVVGNVSSTAICLGGVCNTTWPSGLAGGGTVNYVSKFTGTGTLGNSLLFDNGTNVGVGTASPDANYKITTSAGGIKAESTTQPAGYFNSSLGYGLLVNTGNVGIGTVTPTYKLDVAGVIHTNNDVYVSDATKGIILKDSFDASCARVTLANGNLTTAKVTCP